MNRASCVSEPVVAVEEEELVVVMDVYRELARRVYSPQKPVSGRAVALISRLSGRGLGFQ